MSGLPMKWIICSHCSGNGTGYLGCRGFVLTDQDFYDNPDLYDELENGTYDQPCRYCSGTGKVRTPDTDRMTTTQREAYQDRLEWREEARAERLAEARMLGELEYDGADDYYLFGADDAWDADWDNRGEDGLGDWQAEGENV